NRHAGYRDHRIYNIPWLIVDVVENLHS
ncbi:MAG: hypothetical protein ACI85E_000060, partial [Marinomonas primoryensis]